MMALSETTPKPKATFTVWGADHNFYNTEWQLSQGRCLDNEPIFDASGSPGVTGSAEERQTGFQPMLAFFLANVGNANAPSDPWFNNLFNPESTWSFRPTVDRGYTPGLGTATSRMLEDFINPTGTSSFGIANVHSNIEVNHDVIPEHASSLRAANISWASPGGFLQTNFANVGSGMNLTSYQCSTFASAGRRSRLQLRALHGFLGTAGELQQHAVSAALGRELPRRRRAHGTGSEAPPRRPRCAISSPYARDSALSAHAFTGATLSSIRGVRLTFSSTPTGRLFVTNIRASRSTLQ
jgi:hypothetical protein